MRIMAVTSESLQLRSLMRKIRKAAPGAELTGIRFPKDAIKRMGENAVDAAFIDTELPEMHGLILAKRLQQMNPAVNIIFIAAMDDGYMSQSCFASSIPSSDKLNHACSKNIRSMISIPRAGRPTLLSKYTGFIYATHSSHGMISFMISRNSSRFVRRFRFPYSISVNVCCFILINRPLAYYNKPWTGRSINQRLPCIIK